MSRPPRSASRALRKDRRRRTAGAGPLSRLCIAAVRSQEEGASLRWPAVCGLALALAATVRVLAIPLLAVLALWVLAGSGLPFRRRLAALAVGAICVFAVIGTYYAIQQKAVGHTGLSPNGIWNVYGRVARFADCSKFTPPLGTEPLCETTPRERRPFTYQYTFNWYYSPGVRIFGNPHHASAEQTDRVAAFAWAVIVGQPLDYAEEVGAGLLRYVAPESFRGYGGGPSYHDLVHSPVLFQPQFQREGLGVARRHYGDARRFGRDRRALELLRTYESGTRPYHGRAAYGDGAPRRADSMEGPGTLADRSPLRTATLRDGRELAASTGHGVRQGARAELSPGARPAYPDVRYRL